MACEWFDVPDGVFMMGSTLDEVDRTEREWADRLRDPVYRPVFRNWLMKEYPAHAVRIAGFRMTRFPVRNDDYRAFLEAAMNAAPAGEPRRPTPESLATGLPADHPVWGVRLADAQAYIAWRAVQDGLPWRLPTEEEWEWAAGGPQGWRYPYGDVFDARRCNTAESGRGSSCAVGAHPDGASYWGIEDLAGNVEEWTAGVFRPYPGGTPADDDLMRILGPGYAVLRGGSFALGGDLARTRRRHGPYPGTPYRVTGFRMVLDKEFT